MKKLILSVLTAGALGVGGAASAQDILGSVLPQILGNVIAQQGGVYNGTTTTAPGVYTDQCGRRILIEADGSVKDLGVNRMAPGADPCGVGSYGSYGPFGQLGPFGAIAANGSLADRDRDGIPNAYDRYPDDPRYR